MKKVILLLLAINLWSCGSLKKKETETIKNTEKVSEKTNDSIVLKEINKAINDLVKIKVSSSNTNNKVFDSLVNAKVDEILEKINLQKTSGSNQYQISYNKIKREIEASMKVGETQNNTSEVKKTEKQETKDSEYISTYIKKVKGIPFYWYIIAFIVIFRKQILDILSLFFPVLKANKIFSILQGTSRIRELEIKQQEQNDLILKLLSELTQKNPN